MSNEKDAGKNKPKEAVALKYNPNEDSAPKIIAVGKGEIAENIIKAAKENEIPIYTDKKVADTLINFNIGDEIPPELYEVVAEILVFIGMMDRKYKDVK